MTGLEKLCNSSFPPSMPPSFTSSLNVSNYLFPGDTSQVQANNTQGILCLEEGYLFVGRSWKKDQIWGLPCPHPNHTRGNWAIAQLILNPEHIYFWNNTIIQQTEFSQWTGTASHKDKRKVTLIVSGITALIAALAGISCRVIANHVTAKKPNQSSRGHLRPDRSCH
jgi:hypothetical protein